MCDITETQIFLYLFLFFYFTQRNNTADVVILYMVSEPLNKGSINVTEKNTFFFSLKNMNLITGPVISPLIIVHFCTGVCVCVFLSL